MTAPNAICPICSSQIVSPYYRRNREFPVKSFTPSVSDFGIFYNLHRCDGCHTVFASEMPSAQELANVYQSSHPDGYLLEKKNRQRNFQRLIKTLAKYVDHNKQVKLLDVGASIGLFLETVHVIFPHWELLGVEASSTATEMAARRYGIKLIQGMFETIDLLPDNQDIITMLDLIEHVRSPLEVICQANRLLKSGGILVISTPNIESWTSRLFRSHWWGFRCMHTLYFSPLSMKQMLAKGGFRVITMRGLIRLFTLRYCLRHLGWPIQGPSISIPFPLSLGDMLVIARKESSVFPQTV
ncbi:MAG: class I SAM-dependent methyltransferase [PVC group bacterium]